MKNALEDLVRATHQALLRSQPQFCSCEKCRDDVMALALNQTRPRYIAGDSLGSALTRVLLEQDQAKAEIAVVVYDSMRRVAANPRHEGETVGGSSAAAGGA